MLALLHGARARGGDRLRAGGGSALIHALAHDLVLEGALPCLRGQCCSRAETSKKLDARMLGPLGRGARGTRDRERSGQRLDARQVTSLPFDNRRGQRTCIKGALVASRTPWARRRGHLDRLRGEPARGGYHAEIAVLINLRINRILSERAALTDAGTSALG